MSTLVNPFHTEHESPDVIGLDNNTAMLLANSKTITDHVTLTLPYVSFGIRSPCTKIYSRTRLCNAAASSPSRPREGDSLVIRYRTPLLPGGLILLVARRPEFSAILNLTTS